MTTFETRILRGEARHPDGAAAPATVTLDEGAFSITVDGRPPVAAAYRDLSFVAVDAGTVLAQLGQGPLAERWFLERFGQGTGALVRGLRDGRLLQRLRDGLVEVPSDAEIDLVEYEAGGRAGIAQLLYHERGVVLAPIEESAPWLRVRRTDIADAVLEPSVGGVSVTGAGRSLPAVPSGGPALRLLRLGPVAVKHRDRWLALRDGAAADAAAIVSGVIPDADYGMRRLASTLLLEGRPRDPSELDAAWPALERAVLGHPPFDESYGVLRAIGGGATAPRWLSLAPASPGRTDDPRIWFFVGLPGNLVAMELVSAGAHATYLFRVVPRAAWTGTLPAGALASAVADVSEALVDARFLREPIALPAAQLAEPDALRYRLALAALPTLAAARARFVARVVHRDAASWEAALRDLVAWHATTHDDTAEWPGRAGQEDQVTEAGSGDGGASG